MYVAIKYYLLLPLNVYKVPCSFLGPKPWFFLFESTNKFKKRIPVTIQKRLTRFVRNVVASSLATTSKESMFVDFSQATANKGSVRHSAFLTHCCTPVTKSSRLASQWTLYTKDWRVESVRFAQSDADVLGRLTSSWNCLRGKRKHSTT